MRRLIASELERIEPRSWALPFAHLWSKLADPVRDVALPPDVRCIGVGGATLGGSSKTPMVLALVEWLSARGVQCAVAAHSYRARPRRVKRVSANDAVNEVGDDALWLARALSSIPICVGPSRSETIAEAAKLAPVIVIDGLLQARPRPLSVSFLMIDSDTPWSTACCPPAGDLVAARERLLACCDAVLVRRGAVSTCGVELEARAAAKPTYLWSDCIMGAMSPDGSLVALEDLRSMKLGLALAVARPERVVHALAARGIHPIALRCFADHGRPAPRCKPPYRLDAWLTSPKCKTKLGATLLGAPVWVLERTLTLPAALSRTLLPISGSRGCSQAENPW